MQSRAICTLSCAVFMMVALSLAESGCAEGGETGGPTSGPTSGAGGSGGGGGSMACTPDATRACYDGDADTEGVGNCLGGDQVCVADGSEWGACEGQVLAMEEDCDSAGDEDCDGIACSDYLWHVVVPGAGLDRVSDVAFDSAGNVVLSGMFSGTVDFGGGPLSATQTSDVFVAKFDASGQHVWSKKFEQTGYASPPLMAIDSGDRIVLAGYVEASINFGSFPVSASQTGDDIYLAKLDANGDHVWSKHLTDQGGQVSPVGNKVVTALDVDSADGILLAGYYTGHWGCAVPINCNQVNGEAGFVRRYDANGDIRWARNIEDTGNQRVNAVAINSADDVAIAGSFQTGVSLGGGQTLTQTSGAVVEGFAGRLDSIGVGAWIHSFGASGGTQQHPLAVTWTSSGELLVAGTFQGRMTLDVAKTSNGASDAFLAAFDVGSGMLSWSDTFGGPGDDAFRSLAVDGAGNISLVGDFDDQIDVGLGTLDPSAAQAALVAKLDAMGAPLWAKAFGNGGDTQGGAVATDAAGQVAFAGFFNGEVDFGGGPIGSNGMIADGYAALLQP